jgi:parvulin-like peptidyl-prolyl isomerase
MPRVAPPIRPRPVVDASLPVLAAGLALLMAVAGGVRATGADPLNRIVLRVNDEIATLYDYEQRRDDVEREIRHRVADMGERQKELAAAPESVFRDMFQELLLNSRADQLAIDPSEKEIDEQINDMKQHFGIKSDAEFQQALQQNGLTLDALRAQARRTLRIKDVVGKEVQAKIKVKDEDLRRYYRKNQDEFSVPEQVQLREVVVLEDGGLPATERGSVAGSIRAAVAGGKSLADAVAPFADKGQASRVVELGWVSAKDLDPTLQAAAWKLKKDELSDPVAARGGLHVLQLLDRRAAQVKPFSEVQQQIQRKEEARLYQEDSIKYLADLETRSLVVADPPPEAANFRQKVGIQDVQPTSGLAPTAGAPSPAASGSAPVSGPDAAAAAPLVGTHPAAVDTSDQKPGGVPPPQPVGAPDKDKIKIPPPSTPPPADAAPAGTPGAGPSPAPGTTPPPAGGR